MGGEPLVRPLHLLHSVVADTHPADLAGLALAAGALLYVVLRRSKTLEARHLLVGGAFYAVFLVAAIVVVV